MLNYLIFIESPEHDLHYILGFKPFSNKSLNTISSIYHLERQHSSQQTDVGRSTSRIVFSTSSSDESLNDIHKHNKYYIG